MATHRLLISISDDLPTRTFEEAIEKILKPSGIKVGGFPEDIFINLNGREDLYCNICFLIINTCYKCDNDHKFCRACVLAWSLTSMENCDKCPMCRCPQPDYHAVPSVDDELNSMRVRCPEEGCNFTSTLHLLLQHCHGKMLFSNKDVNFASIEKERLVPSVQRRPGTMSRLLERFSETSVGINGLFMIRQHELALRVMRLRLELFRASQIELIDTDEFASIEQAIQLNNRETSVVSTSVSNAPALQLNEIDRNTLFDDFINFMEDSFERTLPNDEVAENNFEEEDNVRESSSSSNQLTENLEVASQNNIEDIDYPLSRSEFMARVTNSNLQSLNEANLNAVSEIGYYGDDSPGILSDLHKNEVLNEAYENKYSFSISDTSSEDEWQEPSACASHTKFKQNQIDSKVNLGLNAGNNWMDDLSDDSDFTKYLETGESKNQLNISRKMPAVAEARNLNFRSSNRSLSDDIPKYESIRNNFSSSSMNLEANNDFEINSVISNTFVLNNQSSKLNNNLGDLNLSLNDNDGTLKLQNIPNEMLSDYFKPASNLDLIPFKLPSITKETRSLLKEEDITSCINSNSEESKLEFVNSPMLLNNELLDQNDVSDSKLNATAIGSLDSDGSTDLLNNDICEQSPNLIRLSSMHTLKQPRMNRSTMLRNEFCNKTKYNSQYPSRNEVSTICNKKSQDKNNICFQKKLESKLDDNRTMYATTKSKNKQVKMSNLNNLQNDVYSSYPLSKTDLHQQGLLVDKQDKQPSRQQNRNVSALPYSNRDALLGNASYKHRSIASKDINLQNPCSNTESTVRPHISKKNTSLENRLSQRGVSQTNMPTTLGKQVNDMQQPTFYGKNRLPHIH